jgi:RHS repeat-associated protein
MAMAAALPPIMNTGAPLLPRVRPIIGRGAAAFQSGLLSQHNTKSSEKAAALMQLPGSAPLSRVRGQAQQDGTQAISCSPIGSAPAPIAALAYSLKCDADLIYEYVYNNIEYEPLYGSNKGALGTLLDQRGDDADQAILFVALLRAAGYQTTGFTNITYSLSGDVVSSVFNVPNDGIAIESLLTEAGIPWENAVVNPDGTLASIDISHFIAAVQSAGTWYYFDPSFKPHHMAVPSTNLATALGYTQSGFLADIGGTITSLSISGVNRGNLRSDLVKYASNLYQYILTNDQAISTGSLIGGSSIISLTGSPYRTTMPGVTPDTTFPDVCPNQSLTSSCRASITINMPGSSSSQAIISYSDQTYGHRITVFSEPSGSNYVPTLLIDGAAPSCVNAGTCTNVGPATAFGGSWAIPVQINSANHSNFGVYSCPSGVTATACYTLTAKAGGSYLIGDGMGQVGRGMVEYHRKLLAMAQAAGSPTSSEIVMGENLAAISYGWLAEHANEQRMSDNLIGTTTLYLFGVGITGEGELQSTGMAAPFVDLPLNVTAPVPKSSTYSTTTVAGVAFPTPYVAEALTDVSIASILESGILEQTQAPLVGATAASTIKIVDDNMDASYPGSLGTTYFADGTTTAGQAAFTSTILPAITPHYSSSDLAAIEAQVYGGAQLLVPEAGTLAIGSWVGAGYTSLSSPSGSGALKLFELITGGMSGGFFGLDDPSSPDFTVLTLPTGATATVIAPIDPTPSLFDFTTLEPVDGVTGAYIYDHTDLITGSGKFPYALPFTRTYVSASGTALTDSMADSGIGNGWLHNFAVSTRVDSDPYTAIGASDSPAIRSVSAIAALYVMQDLLSVTPTAQTMTVSSMVARWLGDQLAGNAVFVAQPQTTEEFIALPHADGSSSFAYTAPPGSTARVSQLSAGVLQYTMKDGEIQLFGPTPTGALQSWRFPNGMSVNLTYAGANLSTVSNNLGRSLSFTYSGQDIASVTDDTGRSVQYAYDGDHNLTRVTDPAAATTAFAYDTSGAYDTLGHLTQIFYPANPGTPFVTNWYDPLGRVVQQANANGDATDFYLSGPRSEIVDGLGNRHVTYQTDRGSVLNDDWVLSGDADIFSDTPQQNGIVNVTLNQYDGLDRLTQTTLPEGGITSYLYDNTVNPWANNIASVTRTAKPGSTLSPLVTAYTYDPIWNRPTSITDPLGLLMTRSYDAATGNLLTSVADAGPAPHFNARSSFTYNAVGQVLTATDPQATITKFAYDGFGNQTYITRDFGHLNQHTGFTYDALGNVVAVLDPNGNLTRRTYDADRRLTSTISPPAPAQLTTALTYDPNGQLLQAQQSANGIVLQTQTATYTPTGMLATITDGNGNTTTGAYDADDHLVSVTDPLLRVTGYGYDALGRLTSTTNPAIQAAPMEQLAYTPDGRRASLTDANGHATGYAFDGFDRLATTTWPDASTELLSYDPDGNILTRQTRAGGTITQTFDTLNRLATKTPPPPEAAVTYRYDLAGHLISATDNSSAVTVALGPASYAISTTYDTQNHPTLTSWTPAPSQAAVTASSVTFLHAYDRTNRRLGQSASDNSWLSYPTTASSLSYVANTLNQYTSVGAVTPTYDGNGNLTYDGTFTYSYDGESRLLGVSAGSTSVAGYAYDAQGRRKSKTVGSTTTLFVTDADNRDVLEYASGGGAVQRWYAHGSGLGEAWNQMNVAAATRTTLIPDIQGSVIATLDSATGALTKQGYLPYGDNATAAGSTFRYTGQQLDLESSLYYLRARMYSPALGRFLQTDPAGYNAGDNLYAYVGNDPLNLNDPNGDCPICAMAAGAAIGAAIGGTVDAVIQGIHIYNGNQTSFNRVELGAAVGAGAITGSGAGLLGDAGVGAGFLGRTVGNAVIGSAVNTGQTAVVNRYGAGNGSLVLAPVFGAVGGGGGSLLGDAFNAGESALDSALSQKALDNLPLSDKLTTLNILKTNPGTGPSAAAVSGGDVVSGIVGGIVTGEQPENAVIGRQTGK